MVELFEQVVLNLLRVAGITPEPGDENTRRLADFVIHQRGEKVLIEVKRAQIDAHSIHALADRARAAEDQFDCFLLVTPEAPTDRLKTQFTAAFQNIQIRSEWMSAPEFAKFIGISEPFDLNNPRTLSILQAAAITKGFGQYSMAFVGSAGSSGASQNSLEHAAEGFGNIPSEYVDLARQFSLPALKVLHEDEKPIEDLLFFGGSFREAIVVLSDIKSFSAFVKSAQPDVLSECMTKYYREARELVWKPGGVLDKFIGDAVLAIFNYPTRSRGAPRNALEFCSKLIQLGKTGLPPEFDPLAMRDCRGFGLLS